MGNMENGVTDPPCGMRNRVNAPSATDRAIRMAEMASAFVAGICFPACLDIKKPPYKNRRGRTFVRLRFPTPSLNGSGCEGTAGNAANLSKSSPSMNIEDILSNLDEVVKSRLVPGQYVFLNRSQ